MQFILSEMCFLYHREIKCNFALCNCSAILHNYPPFLLPFLSSHPSTLVPHFPLAADYIDKPTFILPFSSLRALTFGYSLNVRIKKYVYKQALPCSCVVQLQLYAGNKCSTAHARYIFTGLASVGL